MKFEYLLLFFGFIYINGSYANDLTRYYKDCPPIQKNCPTPTEIVEDPNLANEIQFHEGFECHMNRFLNNKRTDDTKEISQTHSSEQYEIGTQYYCDTQQIMDFRSPSERLLSHSIPLVKDQRKNKPPLIDPICFYAGSLRGKDSFAAKKQFYSCNNYNTPNPKRGDSKKGACLSQEYNHKLALMFDHITDCLNFCDQDKYDFFRILNHESAFAPNARSPSGARCMGQLTQDTIEELHKNMALKILYPHSSFSANYEGLDLKRDGSCKHLDGYTIPPHFRKNVLPLLKKYKGTVLREKVKGLYNDSVQAGKKEFYYECKILSNPVQCLLYATLNHRKNMSTYMNILIPDEKSKVGSSFRESTIQDREEFKKIFNTDKNNKDKNFSPSYVDSSDIGLTPFEVYVSRDGKANPKLFETTGGAYYEFSNMKESPDFSMGKVQIFSQKDMEKIRNFVLAVSYNGGNAVVRVFARDFIKNFRSYIASPATALEESDTEKYQKRREIILKGGNIDFNEIKKEFINYIAKRSSNKSRRRKELKGYYKSLIEDTDYILGKNKTHLKAHFSNYTEKKELSKSFADAVRDKCSDINKPVSQCRKEY